MSACRSCGASLRWAWIGRVRMPLDSEPVGFEAVGLVAYNPATGGGKVLAGGDLARVGEWKGSGATLHRSHFATCPDAAEHRCETTGQLELGAVS